GLGEVGTQVAGGHLLRGVPPHPGPVRIVPPSWPRGRGRKAGGQGQEPGVADELMLVGGSRPGASRGGRARTEGRAWLGGARSWRRLGVLSADGGSSTWARAKSIRNRIRFVIVRIV